MGRSMVDFWKDFLWLEMLNETREFFESMCEEKIFDTWREIMREENSLNVWYQCLKGKLMKRKWGTREKREKEIMKRRIEREQ
jgi:exonuclease III